MKTVSRNEIIEAWNEVTELEDEKLVALMKEFSEEQPAVMLYTHAQIQNWGEEEESPLAEIVVAIWKAMSKAGGGNFRTVSPEQIDAADEKNTSELERLSEVSEHEWQEAGKDTLQNYNQREIYAFALEVLMDDYKEAPDLAPENLGMDLMAIKTVIDCLDQ